MYMYKCIETDIIVEIYECLIRHWVVIYKGLIEIVTKALFIRLNQFILFLVGFQEIKNRNDMQKSWLWGGGRK